MRYAYAFAGLVALAAASDVASLKGETFDAFVSDNSLVLAEFFAPWCGHCKALSPEYEEAATLLKDTHDDVKLAKIDCTEEVELCQRFGVEGYPTLKVFRGLDNHTPYSGQRKADAIVSYMKKQTLPAVTLIPNADKLNMFKTSDKVVVVAYFAADDKASNTTVTELADAHRDTYPFAAINDAAMAKAAGVKQPSIVVYKSFDEGSNTFEEKFDSDAILNFIKTSATPLIGEVGPETYADYMASGKPLLYIFSETQDERAEFAKEFEDIAKEYKGKVNFATIDAKAFGAHSANLNIPDIAGKNKWPAIAIQDITNNKKYPFPEQGDVEALSKKAVGDWVGQYVKGALEPSIKSEPIPETQDGPVTIIVAKNYDDIVNDADKDVLVEFYAPWCGHCKALAPKYDDLGNAFKHSTNGEKVVIAKVDATLNDVPDEISGFPTIKLFPAGSKSEPVTYNGARTVEDLAKFVEENGTHKVVADLEVEAEPELTDNMAQQAPAATQVVKDAVKNAAEKVADGAAAAVTAVQAVAGDDNTDFGQHDEL